MMNRFGLTSAVLTVLLTLLAPVGLSAEGFRGGLQDAFGSRFQPDTSADHPHTKHSPEGVFDPAGSVRHWNQIAIDASGLDHTPVAPGETRLFGEQFGPGRASRAMAIVHLAIFEAVNAIEGGYGSYVNLAPAPLGTSLQAAV